MIESVGYTDDGLVWMNVKFDYQGQKATLNISMGQEHAREIAESLVKAANEAPHIIESKDIKNERKREHIGKGGPKSNRGSPGG